MGDDVVFFHEELMLKMRESYTIIDVEIQEIKSRLPVKRPGSTIVDNFAEFCSRSCVNNTDISRLSPVLIREAAKDWQNIPALLIHAKERGVEIDIDLIEGFLSLRMGPSPLTFEEAQKLDRYMSSLKSLLSFPLMGKDLSFYSEKINRPFLLHDRGILPWQVSRLVYNIQILQAVAKVEDSILETSKQLGLTGQEYELLVEDDIPMSGDVPSEAI